MTAAGRRWAVVPAAGQGARFGAGLPKQYTVLLGRPMLGWTLRALLADRDLAGVVVALSPGDARFRGLPEAADPRVSTCDGGDRRETSVRRALEALDGLALATDWVLVHDAARPCLRPEDVQLLVDTLGEDAIGGLLAVPVSDTLKRSDGSLRVDSTVAREKFWRAQTPQMFRYGLLRRALALCADRGRAVTDEAAAVEALGLQPRLVHGHADNLKVTTPEDALLAEAILRVRTAGAVD